MNGVWINTKNKHKESFIDQFAICADLIYTKYSDVIHTFDMNGTCIKSTRIYYYIDYLFSLQNDVFAIAGENLYKNCEKTAIKIQKGCITKAIVYNNVIYMLFAD